MRTKLELSDGSVLGLSNDIAYSITYSIADIREPDKRNGSYSKTVTIPSSKEADLFFKGAFDIDSYDNYNTNKKADCIISVDDFEQLRGTLQLLKINVTDRNSITYDVALKGNVANIFTDAGDKYISEIDFSDLSHAYTKENQIASWSAEIGEGYFYPMTDYGYTNGHEFDVTNFFPSIYVREYLKRIFLYLGYKWSSDFLDSELLKRLIIPNVSEQLFFNLTDEDKEQRIISGGYYSGTLTYTIPGTVADYSDPDSLIIPFDLVDYDYYSQLNLTTHKVTVEKTGNYIINFITSVNAYAVDTDQRIYSLHFVIRKERDGIITTEYSYDCGTIHQTGYVAKGGASSLLGFKEGDIVHIGIMAFTNLEDSSCDLLVKNPSFNMTAISIGVFDGNDIQMNSAVVPNLKIKDFLKWIVQMFNLYIEVDKENQKLLHIEPRNDFYNNGITLDWTNKLAVDKVIEIDPMGSLNAIRYKFAYKTDSDYWSKKYFDKWQETFGTENYLVDNDFLKNTNKTEIGFTNTISAQIDGTDRVIPQIVSVEEDKGVVPFKKCNIRILYYGGLKETTTGWSYTSTVSGNSTETEYPYCGHLDDVVEPTFDLSFGVPSELYYNATAYTNNNLFNKYHKKFIEEITDKDSKLITCYLNLTPVDICNLDFRNQFYIDGILLRLNKIIDYNPLANTSTKCEFIKIKDADNFVPTEIAVPNLSLNESPYL
jgi:hypothetical protein